MEADKRPLLGADANSETLFFRGIGIVVRFIMLAPALATFVLAVALLIQGLADTWQSVVGMTNGLNHHLVLPALEIVDTFLVAMVVLVTSIGIYQLFINQRIPVPEWLRIYDIDDLKAKLIGVVITVLGVNFLGRVLAWDYGKDLLPLGLSVAAVVLALTYFLNIHFRRESERNLGHARKGKSAGERQLEDRQPRGDMAEAADGGKREAWRIDLEREALADEIGEFGLMVQRVDAGDDAAGDLKTLGIAPAQFKAIGR